MAAQFGNPAARERYKIFKRLKKAVREYAQTQIDEGAFATMTAQERESLLDYDPLVRIALMDIDPLTPKSMKMLCEFELAKYFYADLKEPLTPEELPSGAAPVVGLISYSSKAGPQERLPLQTSANGKNGEREDGARVVEAEVVAEDGDAED